MLGGGTGCRRNNVTVWVRTEHVFYDRGQAQITLTKLAGHKTFPMRRDLKPRVWRSKFASFNNILRMLVFYKAFCTKSKQISLCGEHVRLSVCLTYLLHGAESFLRS